MIGLPILGAIGMKAKSKDKKIRNELKPVAKSMLTGGMAFRLKKPDKYKSRVVDRSFSTAIKNANKRRKENDNDQLLQKSGFNIAAIEAKEAGKDSFTYAGKEFPVQRRMKEDGDGMYRMETMTPMNPMGAVPLRRNEMPMAYKQKVVKRTAGAKAIPFTNKNAL